MTSSIPQSNQFKRKYPRRVFTGYSSVLIKGHYFIVNCTSLGEGGISFAYEKNLIIQSNLVITFKIPGAHMISIRGEIRNSRVDKSSSPSRQIYGVQFLPLPIGERRSIRAYVSARTEDEPII